MCPLFLLVKQEYFIIMAQQPKPVACSSLSQSKGNFVESSDRISILLDSIALHILSFLMMEDIARLSVVSKRWRALCISIPSLTFDGMKYEPNHPKHDCFMDFLDRFIFRRSEIKMPQFCVRWISDKWYLEGFRVLTWLHYAARSNVEVLDLELDIRSSGLLQMPLNVFRCESLRFLTVDLHGRILQLPSSKGFMKLQSLTLKRVRVLDKLFVEHVLSFCESLNKLCLDNVTGISNINIRSSSLKYLEIRSYDYNDLFHIDVSVELLDELIVGWKFTPSGDRSLKIAAPHLKYLTWDGSGPDHYVLGNLECLRSFALSLEELSSSSYLVECFNSVKGIEDLVIHVQCLKVRKHMISNSDLHSLWVRISMLRTYLAVECLRKYRFFQNLFACESVCWQPSYLYE
jgi:hypothetical protein